MSDYLTTKELADLLRIKERKVYDLASSGEIPCSRATGKLLFPKNAVDAWIQANSSGGITISAADDKPRPPILLGSHDPLLDWALRESQSGIATIFDGSLDGLSRFSAHEGSVTGLHMFDAVRQSWNTPFVEQQYVGQNVVLTEWCKRERGIITTPRLLKSIQTIADIESKTIVPRQPTAGAQQLFDHLLREHRLNPETINYTDPVRTETEAALMVLENKADAALGLKALALQHNLAFVPVITERYDLLIDRKFWFGPQWQTFLAFCRTPAFEHKADSLSGYDITNFGAVHFNA